MKIFKGGGEVVILSYFFKKSRRWDKIYSGVPNMLQHTCPLVVACAKSTSIKLLMLLLSNKVITNDGEGDITKNLK